jgi:hypothetical protein
VTRIVALHFQRTLVQRALERAESAQDGDPLVSALAAAEPERLQVEVSWR